MRTTRRRSLAVVGKPMAQGRRARAVTGQTRYADDLSAPRMLHMKLLRSTQAHARIVRSTRARPRRCPA
jgi:carbon-monoxide dehydrogenase large subunit